MVRNERRITVRSGELTVGLLSRSTHGPETWSWALTGVPPPDDEDFVWRGDVRSEHDAFDQIEFAWARWVWWAGLVAVAPLYAAEMLPASSSPACLEGTPAASLLGTPIGAKGGNGSQTITVL